MQKLLLSLGLIIMTGCSSCSSTPKYHDVYYVHWVGEAKEEVWSPLDATLSTDKPAMHVQYGIRSDGVVVWKNIK